MAAGLVASRFWLAALFNCRTNHRIATAASDFGSGASGSSSRHGSPDVYIQRKNGCRRDGLSFTFSDGFSYFCCLRDKVSFGGDD